MKRFRAVFLSLSLVLLSHLLLPFAFIMQLAQVPAHDLLVWLLALFIAAGYVAYIFIVGAWSWFGTPARYAWPVLLALIASITFPAVRGEVRIAALLAPDPIIALLVGSCFSVLLVFSLRGRRMNDKALELAFPLRGGVFCVGQGGNSMLLNAHTRSPSQRYALDLLKVSRAGLRAHGLYPADPARYASFGAEVVSPCEGMVAAAVDGCEDFSPPERDPEHRAGNFVALECERATIYLAHLMKGSLRVKAGDRVSAGQLLGRVGNSGNTTEPHLHIHAEEGPYPGQFSGQPGIPVRFHGRFLVRNDHVRLP